MMGGHRSGGRRPGQTGRFLGQRQERVPFGPAAAAARMLAEKESDEDEHQHQAKGKGERNNGHRWILAVGRRVDSAPFATSSAFLARLRRAEGKNRAADSNQCVVCEPVFGQSHGHEPAPSTHSASSRPGRCHPTP